MIARFFHAWERHLASVSKDRVVRPFEWGLDWIDGTGHSPNASPESVLLDWAAAALSNSQKFFDLPETSNYSFKQFQGEAGGALSFPSALTTPHAENNLVTACYFPSTAATTARRAVLVLPQWNADATGHVGLCHLLNRFGLSALRMTLPYHDSRRPSELHRADYIVSSNIARTVQVC